jgi:hypothetical protein
MNTFLKLAGGKVELRQTNGNLIRYLGNSDTIFADLNSEQNFALLTLTSGRVELRQVSNNNLVRYLGNGDAVDARWSGQDILICTKTSRIELRSMNNNLIRNL